MQNEQPNPTDLIHFSKEMSLWIKEFVAFGLHLIRRSWYLFVFLFGLWAALFWTAKERSETVFTATAQMEHNELVKKVYGDMILELQRLIDHHAYDELSDLLNFPIEKVPNILSISATNVAGSALHEDITLTGLPFYVHVMTLDKESVQLLENGILYYLINSSKNAELLRINSKLIKERYDFYDNEINRIDQVIGAVQSGVVSGAVISDSIIDIASLFVLKEKFNDKRIEFAFAVEHYQPLGYVYGFSTTDSAVSNFNYKEHISRLLLFMALALALSFLLEMFSNSRKSQ